jgi:8-oxo-dGTP pyrophosphatase MutT (NUDIX family)
MARQRVVRDVSRVVLLDTDGDVLLLHGFDPEDSTAGRWWFTPGGGVEDGETLEAAALRELEEETGLRLDAVAPLPGERTAVFDFDGRVWEQRERYFAARVQRFELDASGWTEGERRSLLGAKWWSVEEMRAASQRFFPDNLLELVAAAGALT